MVFKPMLMGATLVATALLVTQAALAFADRTEGGPAAALTNEISRTHSSTGHLHQAYRQVVPPNSPPNAVNGDSPGAVKPAEPEYAKTQSRNAGAQTDISDQEQMLAQITEELELTPTEHTRAVDEFYNKWDDRYSTAWDAHRRLEWRIRMADRTAPRYFETQRNLTRVMPNPERRRIYQQRDAREEELYQQWQAQANRVLGQSSLLMEELRQLDLEIAKLRLSANFAALYQEFAAIPTEVNRLHLELESFRDRSRSLEQTLQGQGA